MTKKLQPNNRTRNSMNNTAFMRIGKRNSNFMFYFLCRGNKEYNEQRKNELGAFGASKFQFKVSFDISDNTESKAQLF